MDTYLQIRQDYERYSDIARETAENVLEMSSDVSETSDTATAIDSPAMSSMGSGYFAESSGESSAELSDESTDESMDLFEGLSGDVDVKNYCLSMDELQLSIDSSYMGITDDAAVISTPPNKMPATIPKIPEQIKTPTSTTRGGFCPKYAGTFIDPLRLGTHKTQTTYRNICAFSCRSDTWVSVGHITTNIVRCPNLATGKYFCDRCYDIVVRKNAPRTERRETYTGQRWRVVERAANCVASTTQ